MSGSHNRASQRDANPKETHETARYPPKEPCLWLKLPAKPASSSAKLDSNNEIVGENDDDEDKLYGKDVSAQRRLP
jgi:hypothetical protein